MKSIRAIIFKDGDQWVGQCLEYDIAAQARDLETVRSRLIMTIEAEAEAGMELNGDPFGGIGRAPKHFYDMWDKKGTTFRDKSSIDGENPITIEQAIAA